MVREKGISKKEAEDLLFKYGPNEINDTSKTTPLMIFLRQIKNNFVIYLLTMTMILSFAIGKTVTAYTVLAVITLVIMVGFIQEFRADKAISALKGMLVSVSIVIRDGKEKEINSSQIVPGDLLILRNGEKVPADCIIIEEKDIRLNESVLTGESKEITKRAVIRKDYTDDNMVFMGSYIVNGKCLAKVLHTGMNTRFGKIAGLISKTEKELPLQDKVNKIAKVMSIIAVVMSVLTGALMLLRAGSISWSVMVDVLLIVIALSVAAFPEGFPVVLMTTLASGAHNMAKKNVIVNRMSIIETIGETTVICSDKTGTITKGEMTVKKIMAGRNLFEVTGTGYEGKGDFFCKHKKISPKDNNILSDILKVSVLCNDSFIERTGTDMEFKSIGSSTESALLILGAKAGLFKEDMKFKRVEEFPFDSSRKMMSVVCQIGRERFVYSKGAPEYLIRKCQFVQKERGIVRITARERNKLLENNRKLASESLRSIAFAFKKVSGSAKDGFEDGLVFLGLAGMEDPPREGVKEAIKICFEAGIKVKMITGDNRETALSIAKEIGLLGGVIEGSDLDKMTDDELAKNINNISIFARVKPEHKLRIINALKMNKEIVTMTGDGVNDAPALKDAHIGIAMGKNGTDVSRSVADITLKDDNFITIVSAIAEGRTIFKNIRKFTAYQVSCTIAELAILFFGMLLAPLFGWEVPLLLALQILFMNLVTSDLPAITLGVNRSPKDVMQDSPRKDSRILNKNSMILILFTGAVLAVLVLLSYFLVFNLMGRSTAYARTIALLALIALEIASAFNFRSFRRGVLNRSLLVNPYMFYASVISLVLTFAIIYTPINSIFGNVPLNFPCLLIAVVVSLVLVLLFDILKVLNNKKRWFDFEHI